jgi:hypothetical protein
MAIGVDQIYLSMTSPETGEYLTANVYTVDGVYEADGVTLRRLSMGQLVMALCLKRATDLETGYFYPDPVTGDEQYEKGIVGRRSPTTGLYHRGYMDDVEDASEQLRCMTEIENAVLSSTVTLSSTTVTYNGNAYTYDDFLTNVMGVADVPTTANKDSEAFLGAMEAKMDEKNTFSQETMIKLQSQTTKRDQAYDMISNVLKSFSTVMTATVNNV